MRHLSASLAGLVLIGVSSTASAAVVYTTPGPTSPVSSVCTVDFDGSTCAGVSYSDTDSNSIVTGSTGEYAQPVGSTGNYLTVGPSAGTPNTITVTGYGNYFGFLAGSLDTYNSVEFTLVGGGILSFTGSQMAAEAGIDPNGDRSKSVFWNLLLDPGQTYSQIVLTSTSNAFETDNHAFGLVPVPAPATLALFGLGLVGLGLARRRRA